MAKNELRDTPGRLLLGWAVLLAALVILAWRIHFHPADYEWTEYPTALGDTECYTALGPGDDRYEPNLKLPGQTAGLHRRSEAPVVFDDAIMFKLQRDSADRHFIYKPITATQDLTPPLYLKTADNHYIEFGAKKFYQPYDPKAP